MAATNYRDTWKLKHVGSILLLVGIGMCLLIWGFWAELGSGLDMEDRIRTGTIEFAEFTRDEILTPITRSAADAKVPVQKTGIVLWPNQQDLPPDATHLPQAQRTYQQKFHFVISTECHTHHDWQSLGNMFSLRQHQPFSNYTRLISCQEKPGWLRLDGQRASVNRHTDPKLRGLAQHFITPRYSPHPKTGDEYPPYAKSASLVEWLNSVDLTEEIVVSMDPDMIVMRPIDLDIDPEKLRGKPIAMRYGLNPADLTDLLNLPGLCDPKIRLSHSWTKEQFDAVALAGAPYIWHRDDLVKIAPLWKMYTEKIRNHPVARAKIGWLADMYSYALAAIHLGLRHELRDGLMVSQIHDDTWRHPVTGWDASRGSWKAAPPFIIHYWYVFVVYWYVFVVSDMRYEATGMSAAGDPMGLSSTSTAMRSTCPMC
jgi:hypothetical protein